MPPSSAVQRRDMQLGGAFLQPYALPFMWSAIASVVPIVISDMTVRRYPMQFLLNALTDEPAHAITALLAVAALYSLAHKEWNFGIVTAAVLGGTVIDIDHIPAAFGYDALTVGTQRPYSHSLLTIAVVGTIAWRKKGIHRERWCVACVALVSHFVRDFADGGTVPLLWPVSKRGFALPYGLYMAVLLTYLAIIVASCIYWRVTMRASKHQAARNRR